MFERLQKVGICLSHSNTIKFVDVLGEDFDHVVKQWRRDAETNISLSQVQGNESVNYVTDVACID